MFFYHSYTICIMGLIHWALYRFFNPNHWYFSSQYTTPLFLFIKITDLGIPPYNIGDIIVSRLYCVKMVGSSRYTIKFVKIYSYSTTNFLCSVSLVLRVCATYLQYIWCMWYVLFLPSRDKYTSIVFLDVINGSNSTSQSYTSFSLVMSSISL